MGTLLRSTATESLRNIRIRPTATRKAFSISAVFVLRGYGSQGTLCCSSSLILKVARSFSGLLYPTNTSEKEWSIGVDTLFEWTWQSHICFVYDRFSLQRVKQFAYAGEGWGMTRNATEIITSDGSATLRFRNPNNFRRNSSNCRQRRW